MKREILKELKAINMHIQEEKWHLKDKVCMFNRRIVEMEKDLETYTKLFPFPNNQFVKWKDSLTIVMEIWDKNRVQLVQLGEKIIQLEDSKMRDSLKCRLSYTKGWQRRRHWTSYRWLYKRPGKQWNLPLILKNPSPWLRHTW